MQEGTTSNGSSIDLVGNMLVECSFIHDGCHQMTSSDTEFARIALRAKRIQIRTISDCQPVGGLVFRNNRENNLLATRARARVSPQDPLLPLSPSPMYMYTANCNLNPTIKFSDATRRLPLPESAFVRKSRVSVNGIIRREDEVC